MQKPGLGGFNVRPMAYPAIHQRGMFLKGQLAASALFTPLFLLGQGYFAGAEHEIRKRAVAPGAS